MKKIVIIILILLQVNLQNLFADATPAFPTFFDYNLIEEPGLELNGPFKRTFSTEFSLGRSYYDAVISTEKKYNDLGLPTYLNAHLHYTNFDKIEWIIKKGDLNNPIDYQKFFYNDKQLKVKMECIWTYGHHKLDYNIYYKYDNEGRLIHEHEEYLHIDRSRHDYYSYNEQGLLKSSSVRGEYSKEFEYREDGKIEYIYYLNPPSNNYLKYDQYSYYENGFLEEIASYDSVGQLLQKMNYIYSSWGNLIELTKVNSSGNILLKFIYRYDKFNRLIVQDHYEGSTLDYRSSYSLDVNGNYLSQFANYNNFDQCKPIGKGKAHHIKITIPEDGKYRFNVNSKGFNMNMGLSSSAFGKRFINKIENINTLDLKEREIYLKKGEYYLSLAGVEENEYGEYELGIEEVTYGNRPIVYPNPSVGELIISNVSSLDLRNIEILDITGKSINSFETNLTKIDVSQLKSGIYFLRLKDPSLEKIEVYKFIKE